LKRKNLAVLLTLLIAFLAPTIAIPSEQSSAVMPNQIVGRLEPPQVTILEKNETGVTLRVDFFGFQRSQVEINGTVLDVLTIPSCGSAGEVGKPMLPMYGTALVVPFDAMLYGYVLESNSTDFVDFMVYPVQEPAEDQDEFIYPPFPTPPFTINGTFYSTFDGWYPTGIFEDGPAGTLRDVRVLPLTFVPFQHNPVQKILRFYSHITVRIEYMEGPVLMSQATLAPHTPSPHFANLYSSLLCYHQPATQELAVPKNAADPGWDFLIITDFALLDAANRLATRRNAQGLATHVVTTLDIPGGTADDIKAYIQNAYDTWNPRPSYLLLLGDAELIPTFYRTVHSGAGSYYPAGFRTGTDLYYAIMNGPEAGPPYYTEYWTPDIFYGRIPVDTLEQANVVLNKTFDYEDRQWMCSADLPGTALVAGYFQDDDPRDGYEDRRFILTSEEIRNYLLGEGFAVERLYTTEAAVNPTNYSLGTYDAGVPLPADLLRPTYPWNAGTADITNAINDGRFVVFHRDHGGSENRPTSPVEGWGDPLYDALNVPALNNNDHYTIVFSINCETGWFDGETDDYATRSFESLCEALIREGDGGAVGVFGATRISTSGWNDDLAKGFLDAIWPNFDAAFGPVASQLTMGEVLNYGKWYMYSHGGWPWDRRLQTYEIFHYFGDPTLQFKIPTLDTLPPEVTITYPADGAEIEADQTIDVQYIVTDNNDPSPTVVVDPSDPILPPLTVGPLTITVTATDCAGNVASASVTVEVIPKHVDIDVRPGTLANTIIFHGTLLPDEAYALIPVAALSTATFDARDINPATVRFGPTGIEAAVQRFMDMDVNNDGLIDRVFYFHPTSTGFNVGDATGKLTGFTYGGVAIEGSDNVQVLSLP